MAEFDDMRFQFLYIERYSMGADWFYPESTIPYNMLRYIVKGSAQFIIDGEEITVKENDIVYIPQGCKMSCCSLEDRFEFYSLRFISTVLYTQDDILKKYYNIPRVIEADGERMYFEEMYHWVKTNHIAKKSFVRGYLYLLIGSLSYRGNSKEDDTCKIKNEFNDLEKLVLREEKCQVSDSRIRIVTDYIVLHPEEHYNPERLAEMVGLSKQRFGSLFKKCTGKSPMEYVKEVKMTTAARKLLVDTDSVSEIAYSVGYEDPNYFIREFKKSFGYTPNRYRIAAKES